VGFVLLLGVGIMVTIELAKLVLRRRGSNPQALTVSANSGEA
jgi:hypothetical protein